MGTQQVDVIEIDTIIRDAENYSPFMTKYEYTKLLACRVIQLSTTHSPMITVPEGVTDPQEIARLELLYAMEHGIQFPVTILRRMPNGREIVCDVSKMIIRDH